METVLISPPFEIKKRADYEKVHLLYAFRSLQGKEHDLFEISLNLQIFSLEKGFYFIYGVFLYSTTFFVARTSVLLKSGRTLVSVLLKSGRTLVAVFGHRQKLFYKKMSSAALNINYQSIRPEGGKFFCFILESVLLLLLLSAVKLGQVRSRTLQRTRQEEKQDMGPTIHKSPATFLSVVREPISVLLILPALVPLVVFACTSRNTQGSS